MEGSQTVDAPNDLEVQKKMEDEHFRLQRQVRIIQTDRQHRTMGVHPQFRRQDQLLRVLKKEYLNLAADLKIARSGAHKKKDKRMKIDVKNTLLYRMKTERECEGGTTLMDQLDGLLQRNNKSMLQLRNLVNANKGQMEERRSQSENRLVATENKLDAARLRFNAVQCQNRDIRQEIDHMLKDRSLFNQAWIKTMAALSKGKKFLTDLIESSTVAYDQRDEWCHKLRTMQEKGVLDQMLQVQEMRDLQKAYDHELKLFHFLAKKGVMRINKKEEIREEEQKVKEEEDRQKELDYHIDILHDIYDYTKENSTAKIIESFEKIEQENFSIYKLNVDFCAENVVLVRELKLIRQEIEDRRDWNENLHSKEREKLRVIKNELDEQQKITEELRNRESEKNQLIDRTMEKIQEIFQLLDCSLEPFQNLLGDKQLSLYQLKPSLSLITEKIKKHVETVYFYEHMVQKKDLKTTSSRLKKFTVHLEPKDNFVAVPLSLLVPADPCPACVEARWMSRVSDHAEHPLTPERALAALERMRNEPAYEHADRVHTLADCRLPASRLVLARRYM